jgi:hypothetical protein
VAGLWRRTAGTAIARLTLTSAHGGRQFGAQCNFRNLSVSTANSAPRRARARRRLVRWRTACRRPLARGREGGNEEQRGASRRQGRTTDTASMSLRSIRLTLLTALPDLRQTRWALRTERHAPMGHELQCPTSHGDRCHRRESVRPVCNRASQPDWEPRLAREPCRPSPALYVSTEPTN